MVKQIFCILIFNCVLLTQLSSFAILLVPEKVFDDENVVKLVYSIQFRNEKKIKELIVNGVDIDYKGSREITPLYYFFLKRDYNSFKRMLELGANPYVSPNYKGLYYLLNFTMEISDEKYFKLLLKHDIDINYKPNNAMAPIYFAMFDSVDVKYVKLLIEHKVDPGLNPEYWTHSPLLNSLSTGQYDKAMLLLEYYPDYIKEEKMKNWFIEDVERPIWDEGSNKYMKQHEFAKFLKDKFGIELKLKN